MWLFAGILAVPLIEIALFVTVGGWIGLWATLAIVIATAVAGVSVIRWQGLQAMERLRQATQMRRNPLGQMADNALIAMSGVLLVLPGFLTDTLGLLLLVPPIRHWIIRGLAARGRAYTSDGPGRQRADVIDGEFFEIEQETFNNPHDDRTTPARRQH